MHHKVCCIFWLQRVHCKKKKKKNDGENNRKTLGSSISITCCKNTSATFSAFMSIPSFQLESRHFIWWERSSFPCRACHFNHSPVCFIWREQLLFSSHARYFTGSPAISFDGMVIIFTHAHIISTALPSFYLTGEVIIFLACPSFQPKSRHFIWQEQSLFSLHASHFS